MPVALVTDSTASLPADVVADRGIRVVPVQVVLGAQAFDEGAPEVSSERVAQALADFVPVSTSRPAPAVLTRAYADAIAAGATEIVSVHLSGQMSGTLESAQLAAREAGVPVHVVDSGQVGMGTGFAVLAAADALAEGADAETAAQAARDRAAVTTSLFYVDTLEYLRRGGRVGAAAALFGSALAVKPILRIEAGRVVPHEKVRTAGRALARLEELAVEAAGTHQVEVAIAHLAADERARTLASRLTERLPGLEGREVVVGEVGAVLGAHVGPGMVAVSVARRD